MLPRKISDIISTTHKITSQSFTYKKDFFGDAPAPFIGHYGYPRVNVGVLATHQPSEDKKLLNDPHVWRKKGTPINDIVRLRSSLINSRFQAHVKGKKEQLKDLTQEVGLSKSAVDMEVQLKDKPRFRLHTDTLASPTGPQASLEQANITSSPKVPTVLEKAHSDTDLKSAPALSLLYQKGLSEHHLSQVLSVGALGIGKNRKLVPTRWSITATDDTLGKSLLKEVKDFSVLSDYRYYFAGYLGNYYLLLVFPEVWSYELFELLLRKPDSYSTDYEFYGGRKTYSFACEGGYYTVRLAATELMKRLKRQASVVALRFITDEYSAPLGVWVTREAARKACQTTPLCFSSQKEMIDHARQSLQDRFHFDIDLLLSRSKVLQEQSVQTKLFSYSKNY